VIELKSKTQATSNTRGHGWSFYSIAIFQRNLRKNCLLVSRGIKFTDEKSFRKLRLAKLLGPYAYYTGVWKRRCKLQKIRSCLQLDNRRAVDANEKPVPIYCLHAQQARQICNEIL